MRFLVLLLLASIVLAGCGGSPALFVELEEYTRPTDTGSVQADVADATAAGSEFDATAQEQRPVEAWDAPLAASALINEAAASLAGMANSVERGEMSEADLAVQLGRVGKFMAAVDDKLAAWQPQPDLADLQPVLRSQMDELRRITEQWAGQEISPSQAKTDLNALYAENEKMLEGVLEQMGGEGFTSGEIGRLMNDILKSIGAAH